MSALRLDKRNKKQVVWHGSVVYLTQRFFRDRAVRKSQVAGRESTSLTQWLATVRVKTLLDCFTRRRRVFTGWRRDLKSGKRAWSATASGIPRDAAFKAPEGTSVCSSRGMGS